MRRGLFLPLFDDLSHPASVAELAAEAENAGWDGVFVWDHIAYAPPVERIADAWITLAAIASATGRIRLGPMVTPLPRRRPIQVARAVATLDHLSGGRMILGVGIGDDGAREFSGTGDETDPRRRGAMLDEGLEVITGAWSGAESHHRGDHYVLDGLAVRPVPVQQPRPPIWVAMRRGNRAPLRRAARYDGVFPIELESTEQLRAVVSDVRSLRGDRDGGFDVAVEGRPDVDAAAYEAAGATWWLTSFSPFDLRVREIRAVARAGPG